MHEQHQSTSRYQIWLDAITITVIIIILTKNIIVTNLALQAEQAATPCLARLVESEDKGKSCKHPQKRSEKAFEGCARWHQVKSVNAGVWLSQAVRTSRGSWS